jgi:hypothetical protein
VLTPLERSNGTLGTAEALRSDIYQIVEGHRRELEEKRDEFRDKFKTMRALMFDRKT